MVAGSRGRVLLVARLMPEWLRVIGACVFLLAFIVACYRTWMNTPMHPESDDDAF